MVKTIRLVSLIFLIVLTSFCFRKKSVLGKWQLEFIEINDERIFDRNDFTVSLEYNYSLNLPANKEDSLAVESMALSRFEKSKNYSLYFDSDSTFITSKMRSGGKLDVDQNENGTYYHSKDTLFLTVPSRNDYKFILFYKKKKDLLFIEQTFGDRTTYIQYSRVKEE